MKRQMMKRPLTVPGGAGVFVLAALFVLFAEITREVTVGQGPFIALDQWVLIHISFFHHDRLTGLMIAVTELGGRRLIWGGTFAAALLLVIRRKYASAAFLLAVVTGAWFLEGFLKDAIQRPRPVVPGIGPLAHARGWSYPSSHATLASAFYGALAYLGAGALATDNRKKGLWSGALALAVLIALTRIYLQVHHLSDIIAGLILGLVWLMVCIAVTTHLTKRWPVKG